MRRFGEGIARRAKWIWGGIILGLGWYLNNLFGTVVMDWSAAAVKTPGVKRLIALATLFLAAHPFATYFAVIGTAILVVVALAYQDSRKIALAPSTADPVLAIEPPKTEPVIAPPLALAANIELIICRNSIDSFVSHDGEFFSWDEPYNSTHAYATVAVFSNRPKRDAPIAAATDVGVTVRYRMFPSLRYSKDIKKTEDVVLTRGVWMNDQESVKFKVGETHELILAAKWKGGFHAIEWRAHKSYAIFKLQPGTYGVHIQLFDSSGVLKDFNVTLAVDSEKASAAILATSA